MSDKTYIILKKLGWTLFFLLIFLNIINTIFFIKDKVFIKGLPFELNNGKVENIKDSTLIDILENKIVIKVDTFQTIIKTEDISASQDTSNIKVSGSFMGDFKAGWEADYNEVESNISKIIRERDFIEITYQDTLSNLVDNTTIQTISTYDIDELIFLLIRIVIVLFIFFNSYLLLKFSRVKENILIMFFFLLLPFAFPNDLPISSISNIWKFFISPFWGILFYHFIIKKVSHHTKLKKLYVISFFIFLIIFLLFNTFIKTESIRILIYIWSMFWMFKGFIILRKEYKKTQSIENKRLFSAFMGIFISVISIFFIIVIIVFASLIFGASKLFEFEIINNIPDFIGIIIVIIITIPMLAIFIGFLWFLGSFTWSLLTGTVLDVKIRSTLIYAIVGVVVITIFGLIDYSLGELLQTLFGKFMGSEFVAGIPATIALLAVFNPVRNKVEKIVDNKLNTSELDFLEKTGTFTENLSEEGVVEGFEEYICENLIHRLPIEKVALISFDKEMNDYKFNEIRGSNVIENSIVEDEKSILKGKPIIQSYDKLSDNPQDISSFPFIIPIIYDAEQKWYLALGKKNDGSIYNKNDEKAFTKLTDKIKLSLKFILAYEDIVNNKYVREIEKYKKENAELKAKLDK
ncbi:MAG: hypothetical protein KAW88_05065 [Candidatus Cloacimonetes bacterium]|nr:hypothetical protein [Candidatus Cloacimonadota bacterium]